MTTDGGQGVHFLSHPHANIRFFSPAHNSISYYMFKMPPKIPEYAENKLSLPISTIFDT